MPHPSFFIAGAPKCGTSSLYHYLRDHPQIFMSESKELHYFAPELSDFHVHCRSEEEYLSWFKDASPEQVIGEGSVLYMYSPTAAKNILARYPHAKFIVIIRNPVDLAASWHAQQLKKVQENIEDFETAWRAQEARALGKNIPDTCYDPDHLQYYHFCALGTQLERFCETVPYEQRLLLLYDDLKDNPRKVYLEILNFLNIKDDGKTDFPVHNRRKDVRFKVIEKFMNAPPPAFLWMYKCLKGPFNKIGFRPLAWLRQFNRKEATNRPISKEFEKEIRAEFEDEIRKIEKIYGQDLTIWRKSNIGKVK